MKKKLLSLIAVSALAVSLLTGCGESKSDSLKMATNAEFPPYEYHDGDEIVGIDVEISQAIAEKLGLKLDIQDMAFDSIIPSIQSGKSDIGAAGMTVTDERLEVVDFSESYAQGVQVIIVKEDSPIKSVDDLFVEGADLKVGVQLGTTGDIYVTDDLEASKSGSVEEFNKGADAVQALVSGKIDCVVIDSQPAKAFVEANEGLKILETSYVEENYAIAVSKDNPELLEKVNNAIKELKADGTLQGIIDKYIKAE